ncbi:hypothetical protein CYMTET_35968 [Cymbomonas tetramitiformis]|uniref:Uncharacterized protein n=1 Tax=Cymbomonas tetramitiformis TaxID=36881 RepID=A0AAE0F859_9CHLO|nr:hypothetical protein CYMTET_35968 [Cymbomonas tetramitiformis]
MGIITSIGALVIIRCVLLPAGENLCEIVSRKLASGPAWRWSHGRGPGPTITLDTLLSDVAHTNTLSKTLSEADSWFRFSVSWRGRVSAFLKVLPFSTRLAGLLGTVCVDIETVSTQPPRMSTDDNLGEPSGEDFEVLKPVRVTSLQQFYTQVKPMVELVAAKSTSSANQRW